MGVTLLCLEIKEKHLEPSNNILAQVILQIKPIEQSQFLLSAESCSLLWFFPLFVIVIIK